MSAGARASFEALLERNRAVVCIGTGGVGKTTVAAALALAAALRGARAMVLTIDPARQLARALGLAQLERGGERVDLEALVGVDHAGGTLHAAMLDQKAAWDAFITNHSPSVEVRDALLSNPFYQQLSGSLAGSIEYMAMEELCRLDESGAYDFIVVDTPPAAHAVDFLLAPQRIRRLLDPTVAHWLSRPYAQLGRGAFRAMSATVRLAVTLLERMMGAPSLRQISAFFLALEGLLEHVSERASRAQALLCSETTAFVLVSAPAEGLLEDGEGLLSLLQGLDIELRGVVLNRAHPLPGRELSAADLERALQGVSEGARGTRVADWLREVWQQAVAVAHIEQGHVRALSGRVPACAAFAQVPELAHDAHSLRDLLEVVAALCPSPRGSGSSITGARETREEGNEA